MATRSLYSMIRQPAALHAAWKKVLARGAAGGSDGMSVTAFARNSARLVEELRGELVAERYVPEPLREVTIPKGLGKTGTRILSLPAVRDKIVQEAARAALEPRLERL